MITLNELLDLSPAELVDVMRWSHTMPAPGAATAAVACRLAQLTLDKDPTP